MDALHYYTHKLIRYNNEVKKLQAKYDNEAKNADEGLQKRFVNKSDTRVAAIFEGIGGVAAGVSNIPSPLMGSGKKEKSKKGILPHRLLLHPSDPTLLLRRICHRILDFRWRRIVH